MSVLPNTRARRALVIMTQSSALPTLPSLPCPPCLRHFSVSQIRKTAVRAVLPQVRGFAPIHAAVHAGHADVVAELLAHGADAGERVACNTGPMVSLPHTGSFQTCGVEATSAAPYRWSAGPMSAMLARAWSDCAFARLLRYGRRSAIVSSPSEKTSPALALQDDFTALHIAVRSGHLACISAIVKHRTAAIEARTVRSLFFRLDNCSVVFRCAALLAGAADVKR